MTEEEKLNKKCIYGLLGKNISYSFSGEYFKKKFEKLKLKNHQYNNFDVEKIEHFAELITENKEELKGLNVTIPYKLLVIPFLDKIDKIALKVGAVNAIKISKKGKLKGYNTDVFGFEKSLEPLLKKQHKKALILGTGGASKAVIFVLKKMNIKYKVASRNPTKKREISYDNLSEETIKTHTIIINCTPLGTYPNTKNYPDIPYQFLTKTHLLYDLIYNPSETVFLSKGKEKGAKTKNGLEMLELQAEKSWEIWNS